MTWHAHPHLLQMYAEGKVDVPRAFSIEAHLLSCEICRVETGRIVDHRRLDRLWDGITETIVVPQSGLIERLLLRAGVSDHSARLLAATRSLQLSWFLAVAVVLAFAVAAAHGANRGYLLFFVVAPLLPLAGVAGTYGPGIDPTYEIGVASPMRSFHLLLIRAAAVLSATTIMATGAALLLPGLDWKAVAWLLPSMGLVTSSLALSTLLHPLRAAVGVAGAWIMVAGSGAASALGEGDLRSVFGEFMQVAFLAVTLVALVVLAARRDRFERGGHQ